MPNVETHLLSDSESSAQLNKDLSLSGSLEFPEVPYHMTKRILMMTSIKAPLFEPAARRNPIEIMGIIDRSASMKGEKIQLVKQVMKFIADQLGEDDKLGIVTYNQEFKVDFPLTYMNTKSKQSIKTSLDNIVADGTTNISDGLTHGIKQMKEKRRPSTVTTALLFTDGRPNVGPGDAVTILQNAKDGYNKRDFLSKMFGMPKPNYPLPCSINTFGFGSDHDPTLLTSLAQKSDGIYYFIQDEAEITSAFGSCLGGLVSVVAQDIHVHIEALNGVTVENIFTKFENSLSPDHTSADFCIRDIQSEENKDIMFEINLPALTTPSEAPIAIAKINLSYYDVKSNSTLKTETTIYLSRPETLSTEKMERNIDLDIEYNRWVAASAMEEAVTYGNEGCLRGGRRILNKAISHIKKSVSKESEKNMSLLADLRKCRELLRNHNEYHGSGKYVMMTNASSHHNQRQTNPNFGGQGRYTSLFKNKMVESFK